MSCWNAYNIWHYLSAVNKAYKICSVGNVRVKKKNPTRKENKRVES